MAPISTEVIGMIASFLYPGDRDCGRLALGEYHEAQEELARVLRVSKAVRGHCLPLLYKDCVVDNFAVLADSLDGHADHPILHAQRLHFMLHPNPYVDLYDLLLAPHGPGWAGLFVRAHASEAEPTLVQSLVEEPFDMAELALVVRDLQDNADAVFRALDTADLRVYLPYIFLDNATVKHYCQGGLYGPLSLRPFITNVSSPPDIVTFHLPRSYPEIYPQCQLPVILGATNRYVFGSPQSLITFRSPAARDAAQMVVKQALAGLLYTLDNIDGVLDKEPAGDQCRERRLWEFGTIMKQTKLEIYGAIQYKVVESWGEASRTPKEEWRRSESLAVFQTELDQMVGPWRGQVILKHREECLPCTACDLDCQRYWKVLDEEDNARASA